MEELIVQTRVKAAQVFIAVLLALYAGNALMAVFITPHTHIGGSEFMPLHLWLALAGSAVLVAGPIFSLWCYPVSVISRHAAAVAIGLECSLATALSGGQIELHFVFFIAMVFLALALDSAILWTFVAVVLVDHAIRGFIFPDSVYGCSMWQSGRPPLWLAFEHAGFVALQLLALLWFIKKRMAELTYLCSIKENLDHVTNVKSEAIIAELNQDLLQAALAAETITLEAKLAASKVANALKVAHHTCPLLEICVEDENKKP